MKRYQNYREESGFTLLELIVTLTILAIVVVLAFGAFRLGIKAWETGDERVEFFYRMKFLVDLMEKEIGSIYPYYVREENKQPPGKKQKKQKKVVALLFQGKQDSIRFISSSDNRDPSTPRGGLREISFFLNKSEKQLMMTEKIVQSNQPFGPTSYKKNRSIVLASDVSDLKFRYYKLKRNYSAKYEYDGEWVGNFTTDKKNTSLPRAVEITLSVDTEKEWISKSAGTFYLPPFIILLNAGLDLIPTKKE